MALKCAKFHGHTISSLENTSVGIFVPPPTRLPQTKYATPNTPNKIGLIAILEKIGFGTEFID